MPNVTYPLDTTGISPANLVRDEPHVLTEINDATYRIIIPDFAPFYQDNFQLRYSDGAGNISILEKGIDFDFCLPYMDASRAIGKYLFGALTIHNAYVQGYLAVDYQTLGDKWVANKNYVLEQLVEHNYNPRVVYWDQLTNVQQTFPPTSHAQDYDTIYGQKSVIEAIDKIIAAILAGPSATNDYRSHVLAKGNVHGLTAADLGISEASTLPLATLVELETLDPVEKLFSLKQMLDSGIIPKVAGTAEIYVAIDDAITALTLKNEEDLSILANQIQLDISTAKQEAIQESVRQAEVLVQNSGGSGNSNNEILTASQYYMSAMFG